MAYRVRIRENSWLARMAAYRMGAGPGVGLALVWGRTIHLHGAGRAALLAHRRWLRHEVAHLEQYRTYGFWGFLIRYFVYWLRYGYYNHPFERAARALEDSDFPEWWEGALEG